MMTRKRLFNSLIFRITVIGLGLVALGFIIRIAVLVPWMTDEITALVHKQHLAIGEQVAQNIDARIKERQSLLSNFSTHIPHDLLNHPQKLRHWLKQQHEVFPLFDYGLVMIPPDGQGVIAEYPAIPGRQQLDFTHRDWFIDAQRKSKVVIGRPFKGRASQEPILVMAKAIFNEQNELLGILAGISSLNASGFLDMVYQGKIGESGGFLVISPKDKLFVASNIPEMVLQPTPPPGINPLHDQAMAGLRGTGITINAKGVEELSAMVSVPSAGWFVVARMPTSEAFAPVDQLRETILMGSATVSIILAVVIVLILRYLLKPLLQAAQMVREMVSGERERQMIPITRHDEVGELIEGYNSLIHEINKDEQQLRDFNDNLSQKVQESVNARMEGELIFDTVVDSVRDGVCIIDDQGEVTHWNRSCETIFGYSKEEILGKIMHHIIVPQSYLSQYEKGIKSFSQTGQGQVLEGIQHLEALKKSGERFPIELSVSPFQNSGKWYAVGIIRDISERIQAETEQKEKDRQLIQQSKMAMMGSMIGAIAHQLKQPLNVLSISESLIIDDYEMGELDLEALEKHRKTLSKQLQYMNDTINDFRNFFRPDKKQFHFSADETVRAVLRLLDAQIKYHSVTIQHIPNEQAEIFGYPNDFQQVIMNLIKNAIDALQEKQTKNPRIQITSQMTDSHAVIKVTDNGGGISKELLPDKVFEEHISTKGDEGTGIGLSICKMIIEEQMKGKIRAHNAEGGAEFVVELPRAES